MNIHPWTTRQNAHGYARGYARGIAVGFARAGAVALLCVAVAGPNPARAAEAKKTPEQPWTFVDPAAPRERELNFPKSFSAGSLFVRHWRSTAWNDWKPLAEARGTVKIPRERVVRLDLSPRSATAPEFFDELPLDGLHTLNMGKANFGAGQLRHLSRLTGLSILNLRGTPTTDEGMVHLEPLVNLETLYLDNTQVTDLGLGALKGMKKLVHLGLSTTAASRKTGGVRILPRITDAGLASLNGLGELQYFNVNGSEVTEAGLANLKESHKLYYLGLDRTQVGDGIKDLLTEWPILLEIHAQGTRLTDAAFVNIDKMKYLHVLDLSGAPITAKTLEYISGMKELESLAIPLTFKVGPPENEKIAGLPKLRTLALHEGQAEKADLDALKKLKPTLEIKMAKQPGPPKKN